MGETIISWTNFTWNPVHGCTRVSEGCRNCYAERISLTKGFTKKPWTKPNEAENVQLKPHKLHDPYKLPDGSRVFVNSMSDLFHEIVPDSYIEQIFRVMHDLPRITFQILTKRPERASSWQGPWMPNIWVGTSIEDRRVLHRLETIKKCGAAVIFLSCEPLLGPLGKIDLIGIDWVIVGGESGPNFRPMDHAWAREIRNQCGDLAIPFFFKQSAAWRTEIGTELEEKDGRRSKWEQYPKIGYSIPDKQVASQLSLL